MAILRLTVLFKSKVGWNGKVVSKRNRYVSFYKFRPLNNGSEIFWSNFGLSANCLLPYHTESFMHLNIHICKTKMYFHNVKVYKKKSKLQNMTTLQTFFKSCFLRALISSSVKFEIHTYMGPWSSLREGLQEWIKLKYSTT